MKNLLLHLVFWLCFFFVWKQIGYFYIDDLKSAALFTLFDAASLALPFYLIFCWITPRLFVQRLKIQFLISFSAAVIFSGFAIRFIMGHLMKQGLLTIQFNFSWNYDVLIFNRHFIVTIGALAGFIIKLSLDWFQNKQRIIRLEKENHLAELHTLKAQINPHFLFNTLNTIYVEMDIDVERARHSLHSLSHLLHYQLNEGAREEVRIVQEIQYLTNYIELQKARKEEVEISMVVSVKNENLKVAPLIMINFVENAFKYVGVNDNNRSAVKIIIHSDNSEVDFQIENTINSSNKKSESLKTGLFNVQRRLQLLYPNKHTLQISHSKNAYSVHLKIF